MARRLGLELELIPAAGRAAGRAAGLHAVDDAYFRALSVARGGAGVKTLGGRLVEVAGCGVRSGIDNGFALLESAFDPLDDAPGVLTALARRVAAEVGEVASVLDHRGAGLLALSQHPDAPLTQAAWDRLHAPRAVYASLIHDRGWDHKVGFDSKAQNGPTLGVAPEEAAAVLDVLLRAAPAFIALFANSPFEGGRPTGLKETRMTLWPRMTAGSRVAADRSRIGLPPRPVRDLSDLFSWIFGPETVIQVLPLGGGYKDGLGAGGGDEGMARVAGDLSLPAFLAGSAWTAHRIGPQGVDPGRPVRVTPSLAHLEAVQWSSFLDTRVRFALSRPLPPPAEFLEALARPEGLERFFADHAANFYLESRVCGTTLPDAGLRGLDDGDVARSALIAPAALHLGVCRDWRRAASRLARWDWATIRDLRERATRLALDDPEVAALAAEVVDLAAEALDPADLWTLAHPRHALARRETGADRALAEAARLGLEGMTQARLCGPGALSGLAVPDPGAAGGDPDNVAQKGAIDHGLR